MTQDINKSRKAEILVGIPAVLVIALLEDVAHCVLLHSLVLLLLHQADVEIYFSKKDLAFAFAPFLLGFRLWLIGGSLCEDELGIVKIKSWSHLFWGDMFEIFFIWADLADFAVEIVGA